MKATISLDASDLLKIARLVHDKAPDKNEPFKVNYESDGITLVIELIVDYFDNEYGAFEVVDVEAKFYSDSESFDLEVPSDTSTQIENVL